MSFMAQQRGLEPPSRFCRPPAFQAGRLPIITLLQVSRQNHFHTLSSPSTAQKAGNPENTLRMFSGDRSGTRTHRGLLDPIGFRDRLATITVSCHVAERVGFEPTKAYAFPDFKAGSFNRSDISPWRRGRDSNSQTAFQRLPD